MVYILQVYYYIVDRFTSGLDTLINENRITQINLRHLPASFKQSQTLDDTRH